MAVIWAALKWSPIQGGTGKKLVVFLILLFQGKKAMITGNSLTTSKYSCLSPITSALICRKEAEGVNRWL